MSVAVSPALPVSAKKDWLIAALVLVSGTLLFWVTDLDREIQAYYYDAALKSFKTDEPGIWHWLYHYGIFVGYALTIAALVIITLSYWREHYLQMRKPALLLVLVVIVGPGLLVNLIFKDHYGRPRPREITEFGGTEKFCYVWQMGRDGKSFPCGHCSMGFYLAVPFLFLRTRREQWARAAAYASLAVGIGFGIVLGLSRIRAGAHFASDVFWSAGFVWLSSLALYQGLKVYVPITPPQLSDAERKKKARRATLLVGVALPVITVGLMLATPYISHKEFYSALPELHAAKTRVVTASLDKATVTLTTHTDTFSVRFRVNAFGFPNSKIWYTWQAADTARYTIGHTGWFTEVRNNITVQLPKDSTVVYEVHVSEGKVTLDAAALQHAGTVNIAVDRGEVVLPLTPAADVYVTYESPELEVASSAKVTQTPAVLYTRKDARLRLHVVVKKGKLVVGRGIV